MDLNKQDNGSRKFILVEQMDYINTVSVPRLKAVIEKNKGGSFVYCELAKLNQNFVERIEKATDGELVGIWNDMLKTGFISCKVNPNDIDLEDVVFTELSLDDKKRFLMEMLDKNQLYVNYCDMEDETFAVSEEDKAFTNSFYGEM
jgi:adenine-specific DNA-methyltransferase